MLKPSSRYLKQEKVGQGTYGSVYKSLDRTSNKTVALKKIRIDTDDNGLPQTSLREIALIKDLTHPNIITLQDFFLTEKHLCLIFEYFPYDLKRFMEIQTLSLSTVKVFLYQILQALEFCHRQRVIHRDLKPQNLLVCNETLKIADFGLARAFGLPIDELTHEVVTLWYRAPEILLGAKEYTFSIDLWSVGCIFAEMVKKKPIFEGDSEIDQIFKIFQVLGTPGSGYLCTLPDFRKGFPKWKGKGLESAMRMSGDGMDLLKKMLNIDPEKRITAAEALRHRFFAEFV